MSAPVFIHPGSGSASVGDILTLSGAEGRHAATVQRLGVGEPIELVDSGGARAAGAIVAVRPGEVDVRVDGIGRDEDPPVTLVQALAKGGRDEQAIEAATELGATRIVPWQARRSIAQWKGPKADKGRERWRSLVTAATKQSRRALVPAVEPLVTTAQLLRLVAHAVAAGERVLVLHEEAATPIGALAWPDPRQGVWLVVGPEGGIPDDEVAQLAAAGAEAVVLGPHVLRTSSAGPAAIAALAIARGTWA